MFCTGRVRLFERVERINILLSQFSPIILGTIISIVMYHDYLVIQLTNGGNDLVSADIPKSLMLLRGQDPYSVEPWAAPYPPLLLLTVAGIMKVTSNNLLSSTTTVDLISQNIRLFALGAFAFVSLTIYAGLRYKGLNGLQAIVPASIFVALPAITVSPLYWFNSDTFGYPILALSILLLVRGEYFAGTSLLAISAIFKIHPLLALPLIIVWLVKRRGLKATLPATISTIAILTVGLVIPLYIPGYAQAVLGFNLSNTGTGTTSFTILNLSNYVLTGLGIDVSQLLTNQIWLGTTALLFISVLGVVWTRARILDPTSVVLLGLLAWLIPLKQVYTHYIVWAMIPILMRGRLGQAILAGALLETADTMATWALIPSTSPMPIMGSIYGFIATSTIYLTLGLTSLFWLVKPSRQLKEAISLSLLT
jgi:hypothetical protein